jgi:hypothetical protein
MKSLLAFHTRSGPLARPKRYPMPKKWLWLVVIPLFSSRTAFAVPPPAKPQEVNKSSAQIHRVRALEDWACGCDPFDWSCLVGCGDGGGPGGGGGGGGYSNCWEMNPVCSSDFDCQQSASLTGTIQAKLDGYYQSGTKCGTKSCYLGLFRCECGSPAVAVDICNDYHP